MKRFLPLLSLLSLFILVLISTWLWTPHPSYPNGSSWAFAPNQSISGLHQPATLDLPTTLTTQSSPPVTVRLADITPIESEEILPLDYEVEAEGIESNLERTYFQAVREAANDLPASPHIQQPTGIPANLVFQVMTDSIDIRNCCGGVPTTPPDPDIAVGNTHAIVVANLAFQIFDVAGNPLPGIFTFRDFFSSRPDCNNTGVLPPLNSTLFDPNVLYDEKADRFIIAIDRILMNGTQFHSGSHYCVAVSHSGDPTGGWSLYAFSLDRSNPDSLWLDFPQAGVGNDVLYMGGNLFETGATSGYLGSRIWAFNKTQMYSGVSADAVERSLGLDFTPQPLQVHGYQQGTWLPDGSPHYFIALRRGSESLYSLSTWQDPFGSNTLTHMSLLGLDDYLVSVETSLPVPSLQQDGAPIAGNDWRPLDFEYRNGFGYTVATVSCNPGSGTVNCIQWAVIDLSNGTLVDSGLYSSEGDYRSFPDVAVDHCGNMAIGYTKNNPSTFPSIWLTTNQPHRAGILTDDVLLKAGEITFTAFDPVSPQLGGRRWGDYTGMTIAPDGRTFWYVGEYSKDTDDPNGRWGTYIGAFVQSTCQTAIGSHQIFIPMVANLQARAGFWRDSAASRREFYITPNGTRVKNYTLRIYVPEPCNQEYDITQATAIGIRTNAFSYEGALLVTGRFTDGVTAVGEDAIVNLNIPDCGVVSSAAPNPWTASWQNGNPPASFALSSPTSVYEVMWVAEETGEVPANIIIIPVGDPES